MPRPKTKSELLEAGNKMNQKLWKLIDSMTDNQRDTTFNFEDRDRNLRDVLIHLYEWHVLLLKWIKSNTSGEKKAFLPDGYNWKTYPKMNLEFWEKHQSTKLGESEMLFKNSHEKVMSLINKFSNEELFTKKYFDWTGTTSLGSYCVSATSSHYEWAIKKLNKHLKSL